MTSFLFHDAAERERLLDLSLRLRSAFAICVVIMCVPALLGFSLFGWQSLVPLAGSVAIYIAATLRMQASPRPERLLLASCTIGILASLASIWIADGPKEYLFAMPVFPMLGMAPIFARRVTVTAALLTCAGLVGVALGSYGDEVRAMPPILILPVMLLLVVVFGALASRQAEYVNRSTSVVDPLTGLLNRAALQTRASELALQARSSGASVGLIVVDLDHFKRVNDTHGHATGDEVLKEVAGRLRSELGPEVGVFRFGGEEFVVLLPNTTLAVAVATAERLRQTIAASPTAGVELTASFGVAVCADGTAFAYEPLFQQADGALYQSKHGGRNRVSIATGPGAQAESAAAPTLVAVERRAAAPDPAAVAARAAVVAGAGPGDGEPAERSGGRSAGGEGNWLVADATERGHVVDLLERCAKDSDANSTISLVALIACGFWLGWWGLIAPVLAGVVWKVCTTSTADYKRPEFAALFGFVVIIFGSAESMLGANQPILFALPMGALITFGACATFRPRGALVICGSAMASISAVAFVMDAAAVIATPFALAFPLALIAATSYLGLAMGRSAREHRVASITDGLTGTLNRVALEARIPQLVQQSLGSNAGMALLVVDIDHFKLVNDEHGHDAGDDVLAEVSSRLRTSLRAFDSVYRVGGEEFVIVLVNITAADARMVAERTRQVIEASPAAGIAATVSIGVAWAPSGVALDYDDTFRVADERLYRAKQTGRNRVIDGSDFTELTLLAA